MLFTQYGAQSGPHPLVVVSNVLSVLEGCDHSVSVVGAWARALRGKLPRALEIRQVDDSVQGYLRGPMAPPMPGVERGQFSGPGQMPFGDAVSRSNPYRRGGGGRPYGPMSRRARRRLQLLLYSSYQVL